MIRLPHSLLPGPGGGPARRLAPLPEGRGAPPAEAAGRHSPATRRRSRLYPPDGTASGYPVNDGYPPRGPGRKRDLRQELVGSQHGGHRGKEEVPGSDRALASGTPHGEPGAERHHHRRQLGGRIGVRENAAERAARGSGGGRRKAWPGQSTGSAHGSAASARARAGGPELRSGTRRRDPDSWWPARPTRLMSITWPGRARRKSSMGTRLWPPARVRASSPWRARRPSASATVRGS